MKRFRWVVVALPVLVCMAAVFGFDKPPGSVGMRPARFAAVDVFVDVGERKLGAWQVEFVGSAKGGAVELVGVEGGAAGAFEKPAYFDPEALTHDRVVIAAYALGGVGGSDLPTGNARVARLHVRVTGEHDPEFVVKVMKAADGAGNEIKAETTAKIVEGER